MNAFNVLLDTLLGDPNLGVDIVYRPPVGAPIACRAAYAQPDNDMQLGAARLRDRKRDLLVKSADVATPAKGDMVEVPAGSGQIFRVMDFAANDPSRLTWLITPATP